MNEGDMVCGRFKKVVVTGGAGFIGSHLVKRLLADGCEVCVVDNLSTGKIKNIEEFLDSNAFEFIEGDVRDIDLIMKIVRGKDLIFHLAAMVGVFLIALDPAGTIETNIKGTESILKAAKKFGVRTLIASSSEVYGKSEAVPFCEEDDLLFGSTSVSRWAYACSKAIDEFLGKAFYQQYGLGVVIARFFNTIGPRQTGQYGMVAPRFVSAAINNRPLPI